MAIALDIIKKKTWLDDTMAQQALDIKNSKWNDAFKEFVNTNKPVQPSPVTPTPVAPTPNTPAPIVNSPVDPTTGLSKPLEPVAQPVPAQPVQKVPVAEPATAEVKPLEPVKTEVASSVTPKVEAPIDYNQAKGREQDIINNLNTFKAQNMTPEQIMKASDYQNATPEKRALIEPYLKVQTPTASAMYNAIATKMDIPDEQKTSLPYKIASNRYAKANMYSSMTPSQLETEIKNAKLVEWSQAYEDLKAMNPKLVQDTENLRKVNGGKTNIFSYVNNPDGTKVKVNNLENTFAQDYIENFGDIIKQMYTVQTPEQIRAIINTPDIIAAQDKATQIELWMNELEKQIENVDKDVEAELKWSGATGSRIALEKSSRKEKLQNEYNSQLKNYTTYANKANNLITQNTSLYLNSQAQKEKQAQAMLPILQDQYKTAQAKAQAEQALNDPATQIGQTMAEFEKMGITSQGSLASKIAEFKQSGLSLPEYVNNLRKLYMAKPEYQRIQAQEAGKGISYQTIWDKVYKNTNGVLTETGISAKKTAEPVWQEWEDASGKHAGWVTPWVNPTVSTWTKPTGNIVQVSAGNKTVRLDQVGAIWFENAINQLKSAWLSVVVWQWARDQTATIKSMAEQFGIPFNASNPAETAQKLRNAGHQVADPWKSNHESGMAIDVYGNSKLDAVTPEQERILNANGWYSAGIPWDAGHFEYRGGGTGTQATGEYTDQNINDLAYLVELQEKNPTQAAKDMKELGYNARDLANYKAWNVPMTEKQKNSSIEVMNAIKDLADPSKYEWNDAVWFLAWTPSLSGWDAANATMAIDNLVAKLTLPNLWVLKWPMSDKDIQFIKEASSKLSRNQSDASFERNLIDAYNLSARRAGKPEITKLSDISTGTKSGTVGGELDYSKYE